MSGSLIDSLRIFWALRSLSMCLDNACSLYGLETFPWAWSMTSFTLRKIYILLFHAMKFDIPTKFWFSLKHEFIFTRLYYNKRYLLLKIKSTTWWWTCCFLLQIFRRERIAFYEIFASIDRGMSFDLIFLIFEEFPLSWWCMISRVLLGFWFFFLLLEDNFKTLSWSFLWSRVSVWWRNRYLAWCYLNLFWFFFEVWFLCVYLHSFPLLVFNT